MTWYQYDMVAEILDLFICRDDISYVANRGNNAWEAVEDILISVIASHHTGP